MIYTPRSPIEMMLLEDQQTGRVRNAQVCTKILYKGHEISIAMDSSLGLGDLTRSDIRVFSEDSQDITAHFLESDESMLYGDAETLLRVMKKIEQL